MAGSQTEREHVQAVEATCEIQATADSLAEWDARESAHLIKLHELNRQAAEINSEQARILAALWRGDRIENKRHCTIKPLARIAAWFLDTIGMRPAVA